MNVETLLSRKGQVMALVMDSMALGKKTNEKCLKSRIMYEGFAETVSLNAHDHLFEKEFIPRL